ncbi:MAG: erg26, C-3 sterol dehydrogenase [Alectoria sarmentosa]|nr:MAG: erg26, C-3 sterol dehydrogenase [Alectoria sarmentosa]
MATSVLITGGTGFLGSAIIDAVQEQHPEWVVTVLDLKSPNVPKPNIVYKKGDITDATSVNTFVVEIKPDVIIHSAGLVPELAFRYGREQRDRVFNVNVNGTRNMLAAAKSSDVKAFVWTGSCTAITDDMKYQYRNIDERWPTSSQSLIYGESKAAAEALVLGACDEKLATCALRPSVIFGPGDYQLIPSIHACIAKGETPFVVGDGENLWDVTYVGNVADAHVLAVENLLSTETAAGEAIFISNKEPIPFRDFCLEVWKNFDHIPSYEVHIPVSLATLVGYIAEVATWITGSTTTLSRGSVLDACGTRYCSGEKARKVLGYKPRMNIEEGIRISCMEYAQRLNSSGANVQLAPRRRHVEPDSGMSTGDIAFLWARYATAGGTWETNRDAITRRKG